MEEFENVAKAREAYAVFVDAMSKGRDILLRAGIAEAAPPVPEFDTVFRRLDSGLRQKLYADLEEVDRITPVDALRIWQPLIKRAFGRDR
jgi:hypothetical protein